MEHDFLQPVMPRLIEGVELRRASLDDAAALAALIARSARGLGGADYSAAQIEAALKGVFGVDTQLIEDGTYWIACVQGELAGCGGWSFRQTLYGSDQSADRDARRLVPGVDAARIRAFFVAPEWARRGIGSLILARCEAEAQAAGFQRLELVATRTGRRLYARLGFRAGEPALHRLSDEIEMECIPMVKDLGVPKAPVPG